MQRLLGQKTASCFQRCVGMDAFNAVFSTTYEIDEAYGTTYHENFKKFITMAQEEDLVVELEKSLRLTYDNFRNNISELNSKLF